MLELARSLRSSANGGSRTSRTSSLRWIDSPPTRTSSRRRDWLASDELADDDSQKFEDTPTRVPDALSTASFTCRQVTSSGAMQSPPRLNRAVQRPAGGMTASPGRPWHYRVRSRSEYVVGTWVVRAAAVITDDREISRFRVRVLGDQDHRDRDPHAVGECRPVKFTETHFGLLSSNTSPLPADRERGERHRRLVLLALRLFRPGRLGCRRRQRVLRLLGLNRGSRGRTRRGCSAAAARRGSSQENTAYGGHDEIERSSTSHDDHLPLIRRLAGAEEY